MPAPNTPSSTPDYYVWRPAGKRVAVHFRNTAMDRIEENVRSAFTYPAGGETGGVLIGSKAVLPDGPAIIIETAEPIHCEHSRGKEFMLSDRDRESLSAQLERLKAEGVIVVGLYRSHARREDAGTLVAEDRTLLERVSPGSAAVFLLVRPVSGSSSLADIFFWHEGRIARETAFVQFPFSETSQQLQLPREPAPVSKRPLRVDVDPSPRELRALNRSYARSNMRKWPFMLVFGVLGAAAGYGIVTRLAPPAPAPVSLGLQAQRSQGQWVFRWNPAVAAEGRAERGDITIHDGAGTTSYSLASGQLQKGEFSYAPSTSTVSFSLKAVGKNGVVRSESVMAIDPSLERPPAGSE